MSNVFFQLHDPWYLLLALAVPLLVLDYLRGQTKRKLTVKFPALAAARRAAKSGVWHRLRHVPAILRWSALLLLVWALARPQSGEKLEELDAQGIDIVLALDVSGSMDLLDMLTPSEQARLGRLDADRMYRTGEYKEFTRLGYAKNVLQDFIKRRTSDRVGLTIFAGSAYTQCPMTLDYGVLVELLSSINDSTLDNRGTAIGDALMNSALRLKDSKAKSRVVVLLTDGANNAGEVHPTQATEVLKALGVRVYTIGIGKESGTFLHFQQNPFTGEILWKEDAIPAENNMDDAQLKTIAATTDGKFFRARDREELEKIYATIDELERSEVKSWSYTRYSEQYPPFLLVGALLLLLGLGLEYTRFARIPS